MTSSETPDRLDPTIDQPTVDPSLLELDGTAYRDLSQAAAAKRAAYREAMFLKSWASSGNTTTRQQISTGAGSIAFCRSDQFENFGTAPDYTTEGGNQGPGQEGWIMHSQGVDDSSRLRFNFPFNDGSLPYSSIVAYVRGAPDNGKNSYVCLREKRCADDPTQGGCDEIDIVEYYGQSSHHRSEFTIYQSGAGQVGTQTWPTPTDPGHDAYGYGLYLERGNYMAWSLYDPAGNKLGSWDRHVSQAYVPTQPMYLYVGIWDCSSRGGAESWCFDPPGPFTGDSLMALHTLGLLSKSPG
jgi:Glycosyl hydrolases family 16